MLLHDSAFAAEMLVDCNAVGREPQQPSHSPLTVLDRFAPDVFAVHFEQIEGTVNRPRVGAVAADEIERREPAVVADDGLAIDDAGSNGQRFDRFSGEREAVGEIAAVPRHEPDAPALAVRQDAETVMLDLMNPARARRRLTGGARQAQRLGAAGAHA